MISRYPLSNPIVWAYNSLHKGMTWVSTRKSMCPHSRDQAPQGGPAAHGMMETKQTPP